MRCTQSSSSVEYSAQYTWHRAITDSAATLACQVRVHYDTSAPRNTKQNGTDLDIVSAIFGDRVLFSQTNAAILDWRENSRRDQIVVHHRLGLPTKQATRQQPAAKAECVSNKELECTRNT